VVKFSYQYTDSPLTVHDEGGGGGGGGEEAEEAGTPLGGAFLIHWSFGF